MELEYTIWIIKTERPNELQKSDLKFAQLTHLKVVSLVAINTAVSSHLKTVPCSNREGFQAIGSDMSENETLCMTMRFSHGELPF